MGGFYNDLVSKIILLETFNSHMQNSVTIGGISKYLAIQSELR